MTSAMNRSKQRKHAVVRIATMLSIVLPAWYLASRHATVLPAASAASGTANSYTTNFPHTENPISEGGRWISGRAGLDWGDVRTIPGFAFGIEIGGNRPEPDKYDDPTAILTGKWGPNQTAQARVHRTNKDNDHAWQEVELRLRSSIAPHNATGYEIMFRCSKSPQAYCNIARWDGILGAFMMLKETKGSQYGVADGDEIKATMKGDVITVYKNGVLIVQTKDYLFKTGNPGIGFYLEGATGVNNQCGFSSFTATSE
jgi:hypothetical protein